MNKRKILIDFVRHGQSTDNADGLAGGWSQCSLTPDGRAQARELATHIDWGSIEHVVSSDLPRAVETAHILMREGGTDHINLRQHESLREVFAGKLEGGRHPYPKIVLEMIANGEIEGAETLSDIEKRCKDALEYLTNLPLESGKKILVVAHRSYLACMRAVIEGRGAESFVQYRHGHCMENCEIYEAEIEIPQMYLI